LISRTGYAKDTMIKRLQRYFITGLVVLLPLYLSLYILFIIFMSVDNILGRFINIYLERNWGIQIYGLGFILFLVLITAIGFLSKNLIGRMTHRFLGRMIIRFPFVGYIYQPLKQIFEFLFSEDKVAFKKTVLVRCLPNNTLTIGFVTNEGFPEAQEKIKSELVSVFVPTVPNPTTGFLLFVPRSEVIFLDINIKDAIKLIVSGGMINPESSSLKKHALSPEENKPE